MGGWGGGVGMLVHKWVLPPQKYYLQSWHSSGTWEPKWRGQKKGDLWWENVSYPGWGSCKAQTLNLREIFECWEFQRRTEPMVTAQKKGPWAVIKKYTCSETLGHIHTCTQRSGVKRRVRFTRCSHHRQRWHALTAGIIEHPGILSLFLNPSAAQMEKINVNLRPLGYSHNCYHFQGDVKQVGERFYINLHQDHRCHPFPGLGSKTV